MLLVTIAIIKMLVYSHTDILFVNDCGIWDDLLMIFHSVELNWPIGNMEYHALPLFGLVNMDAYRKFYQSPANTVTSFSESFLLAKMTIRGRWEEGHEI